MKERNAIMFHPEVCPDEIMEPAAVRIQGSPQYSDGDLNMWVDYRGSLSTVYNDGEISTCG